MGKAHALAYRAVPNAFPESLIPRMVAVADIWQAGARGKRPSSLASNVRQMTGGHSSKTAIFQVVINLRRHAACTERWHWQRSPPASMCIARSLLRHALPTLTT